MDRLSIFLTLMTGAVITGGLVIVAFTLNYYGWVAILASVIIGFALAWPTGYWISRRIKRVDPDWDARRERPAGQPEADRNAPKA